MPSTRWIAVCLRVLTHAVLFHFIAAMQATGPSWTIDNLAKATAYRFEVEAENAEVRSLY